MTRLRDGEQPSDDEVLEELVRSGELEAYQDWDSGGPGAGAGRVSVYRAQNGRFFSLHDAGIQGPFTDREDALRSVGIEMISDATVRIWDRKRGVIFAKR